MQKEGRGRCASSIEQLFMQKILVGNKRERERETTKQQQARLQYTVWGAHAHLSRAPTNIGKQKNTHTSPCTHTRTRNYIRRHALIIDIFREVKTSASWYVCMRSRTISCASRRRLLGCFVGHARPLDVSGRSARSATSCPAQQPSLYICGGLPANRIFLLLFVIEFG